MASYSQHVDEHMRARVQGLEKNGFGAIDALHLACAEAAGSQYFLTCDDRVVRRYSGGMQVLNPVNFVMSTTGGQP
jgi:predicted nucleic acid-binding protein